MKSILLAVLLFFCCLTNGYAKEKITWMVLDWPPWMIIEGEDKGTGRFNFILRVAQENLPEYDHVEEKMNWARFWHEVEDNNNVCYPFGLKSGNRDEIAYYSAPHTLVLPNAIIIRKDIAKKLGNPSSYSIVELIQDQQFKGYVEKNRSFTKEMDGILKQHEGDSNLTRVSSDAKSLVKMVIAGRIDYTLEYPIVAAYFERENGYSGTLTSIPISEMEPFSYVYMSCTKNEWGKKIIAKWNEALKILKPTEKYRKITEIGHTDTIELLLIRKYYDDFINEQK